MSDYIVRGTAADQQIRVFAATTRNMADFARQAHETSPVVTAALGRLLTAGAILGSTMKGEKDLITLKINCSGPIQGLMVTANASAEVKGYPFVPQVSLPPNEKGKLDVSKALDLGVLSVIKDIGMKEPYIGQTHLVSGEIAEDLTYYFAVSEQIPTSMGLGVLMDKENFVKQAGGFMIQLMPGVESHIIDMLEDRIQKIESVTALFEDGHTPESMLQYIFEPISHIHFYESMETKFECGCSKEKIKDTLISLGSRELMDMIEEKEPVEVHCHFCNTYYHYEIGELKEMVDYLVGKRSDWA